MEHPNIFISVGGTSTVGQEDFVKSIEERLRSEGLVPNTVGRNKFSSDSPLKTVKNLMGECSGLIVIALERTFFEKGLERRGGSLEMALNETKFTTPWNQIEAGMAYVKGLPILVIIEDGIKTEGLLEKGHDWYVMTINPKASSLLSVEFNGVLSSWKEKVTIYQKGKLILADKKQNINPEELTIGQLLSVMKPATLWTILVTIFGLITGAFFIGQYFPVK